MSCFFDEEEFPRDIAFGATGGPQFSTVVIVAGSGAEQRVAQWTQGRRQWNVTHGIKTPAQRDALLAYFVARQGQLCGFRFYDPSDHTAADQPLRTNPDGAVQLAKEYVSGGVTVLRFISKPVPGTVTLAGGGVLDENTGLVAGGVDGERWSGEFHTPVRFDTDQMQFEQTEPGFGSWSQIPVIEILI